MSYQQCNRIYFGVPSIIYSYHTDPGKLKETVDFISATFHILAQAVKNNGAESEHLVLAEYALECGYFEKS